MLNEQNKRIMIEWIIIIFSGITLIFYYGGNISELIKKMLEWAFVFTGFTLFFEYWFKPFTSKIITYKKFNIADLISRKKIVTFKFEKISDKEAKQKIITYLNKQLTNGKDETDVFEISSKLNIPARQVSRILKTKKFK